MPCDTVSTERKSALIESIGTGIISGQVFLARDYITGKLYIKYTGIAGQTAIVSAKTAGMTDACILAGLGRIAQSNPIIAATIAAAGTTAAALIHAHGHSH